MLIDVFHYCCVHLQDIASNTADVDFAIRWGFGWQQGPFEIMQAIGWSSLIEILEQHIKSGQSMTDASLPDWTKKVTEVHKQQGSWSPSENKYIALRDNPVYQRQVTRENVIATDETLGSTLFENDHTRLWLHDDDIAILTLKTKMNSINAGVLKSVIAACELASNDHSALILWQTSAPFAVGADLSQVGEQLQAGNITAVENIVAKFQQASMALKHCRVPTVAAVQGMALGGGCEFQMHCNVTVAAMESYIGLVEAGVGLLPAGGGLKELALKAMHLAKGGDIFPHIQAAFELTAMAKVSASALDARNLGLLSPMDVIVANPHELLHVALHHARALAETANSPPRRDELIKVTGKTGKATLMMIATNMLEGHFISPHDYKIAEGIATVLTGGDVENGSMVSQDWLLKLERDYFIELIRTEKTQQRIVYTLKTGKPLRN